jgi:hypothetical protein
MPATNITQILNWSEAINPQLAARLNTCGVAAYVERSTEDLPDSYALPMFIRGKATGHLAKLPAVVGGYEHDIFSDCLITIELFSPRIQSDPTATYLAAVYDKLGDLATRARYAFRFNARDALNALLPYHHIDPMLPQADIVGFDETRKIDRHTLTWICLAGVDKDAWPTTLGGYDLPS